MKIHSNEIHKREIRASLPESEYQALIAAAVAKQAGVSLERPGVAYRVLMQSRDTSVGFEYWAEVVIEVDMRPQPAEAEPERRG